MRIALAADELTGIAGALPEQLRARGHELLLHGAYAVAGVRAALCADAQTAAGARRWNDANVLALSLRATSEAELTEILDAWLTTSASEDETDARNISHLAAIEQGRD